MAARLRAALPSGRDPLARAMRYAVEGGKRLRPLLCLAVAKDLGEAGGLSVHAACAVEMIHGYSLVHDDLPCIDDDDMRRGKPSCHSRFGEATALLAGDSLLTLSFAELARSRLGDQATSVLAEAAGHDGMVGGQATDIAGNVATKAQVMRMHQLKTGSLIRASAVLGAMCAKAGAATLRDVASFGEAFGLSYQIADDIADSQSNAKRLGRDPGSDVRKGRRTFVTLLGVDKARRELEKARSATEDQLARLPFQGGRTNHVTRLAWR